MKIHARLWTGLAALWLCGVVAGLGWLAHYSSRPGGKGAAPSTWPVESRLERDPDRATLVMLIHPRCSCSEASVAGLAEVAARSGTPLRTLVLFVRPAGVVDGWEKTGLWHDAARIPDATLLCDDAGAEARRFGAQTSGHALLYASDGRLLFSGGITSSRGHPGESEGQSALLALLRREVPATTETPVFGCDLFDPASGDEHDATSGDCCHDPR